jgi:transglutaminase-like putative cysteine protease
MRICIDYRTHYRYGAPAKSIIQLLKLTPRAHEGQRVVRWRIDIDTDARLSKGEDALGNISHVALVAGPVSELEVQVSGEIETWDTQGIVAGAVERFPPEVFLRSTDLTMPEADLQAFARETVGVRINGGGDELDRLHRLMEGVHAEVAFDVEPTHSATTAAEAFDLKRGVCQDLSHIFIACARSLGVPARYVSGHLSRQDGPIVQEAAHAWAEAHVPGLGWVGFDPANSVCPTPAYVRVAIGLDYLGAAPVRGSRAGGGKEQMDVRLQVSHTERQTQS